MLQKATPKLTEMTSRAITAELQVIIRYMLQHVLVEGMNTSGFSRIFKKPAMDGKQAEGPAGLLLRSYVRAEGRSDTLNNTFNVLFRCADTRLIF